MPLSRLHRAIDRLAMWLEDRVRRAPAPFRPGGVRPDGFAEPLGCFGDLPPLPPGPSGPGVWSAPSPWPGARDQRMEVLVTPAEGDGPARGVALLVPPWKTPQAGLMAGWVRLITRAGLDAWLVVPPYHLTRTPPGARGGEGFVSPDLGTLRAAVGQLTMELRVLSALARQRGGEAVTLGLSLGALGAALAATTPEATPSLALVAPPLDLAAVLKRTPIGRRYRRLAAAAGAPVPPDEGLAPLLAPFDAGARRLVARRVFLAVGRHDEVATHRGSLPLVRGWGVVPHAYARGHLTLLFACRQVRADLAAFLGPAPEPAPA